MKRDRKTTPRILICIFAAAVVGYLCLPGRVLAASSSCGCNTSPDATVCASDGSCCATPNAACTTGNTAAQSSGHEWIAVVLIAIPFAGVVSVVIVYMMNRKGKKKT